MKKVLIFRYARTEGPGHFATFLSEHGLLWELVRLDEGEPVPPTCAGYAGLGFMGGPMSANDEYPWTQPVLELMRCNSSAYLVSWHLLHLLRII